MTETKKLFPSINALNVIGYFRMQFRMISQISQYKIFWSIIISNFIKMMHSFIGFEISAKYLFHHKTMFGNTSLDHKRMIGLIDKNIPISPSYSTFPMSIFLSSIFPFSTSSNFWRKNPSLSQNRGWFIFLRKAITMARAIKSRILASTINREIPATLFTDFDNLAWFRHKLSLA